MTTLNDILALIPMEDQWIYVFDTAAAAALIKEYCNETGLDPAMAAEHIARMLEKKHD